MIQARGFVSLFSGIYGVLRGKFIGAGHILARSVYAYYSRDNPISTYDHAMDVCSSNHDNCLAVSTCQPTFIVQYPCLYIHRIGSNTQNLSNASRSPKLNSARILPTSGKSSALLPAGFVDKRGVHDSLVPSSGMAIPSFMSSRVDCERVSVPSPFSRPVDASCLTSSMSSSSILSGGINRSISENIEYIALQRGTSWSMPCGRGILNLLGDGNGLLVVLFESRLCGCLSNSGPRLVTHFEAN